MLPFQVLNQLVGHLEMGVPVGVFTRGPDTFIRNLVSTLFAGYAGEIDLMLIAALVDHQYMDQIFVNGSIQALMAEGTEKIDPVSLPQFHLRMLDTCIVPNLRM